MSEKLEQQGDELLHVAREWIWRHSAQPNGDPWRNDPEHLDWAAQNLVRADLAPWLTSRRTTARDEREQAVKLGRPTKVSAEHPFPLPAPNNGQRDRVARWLWDWKWNDVNHDDFPWDELHPIQRDGYRQWADVLLSLVDDLP